MNSGEFLLRYIPDKKMLSFQYMFEEGIHSDKLITINFKLGSIFVYVRPKSGNVEFSTDVKISALKHFVPLLLGGLDSMFSGSKYLSFSVTTSDFTVIPTCDQLLDVNFNIKLLGNFTGVNYNYSFDEPNLKKIQDRILNVILQEIVILKELKQILEGPVSGTTAAAAAADGGKRRSINVNCVKKLKKEYPQYYFGLDHGRIHYRKTNRSRNRDIPSSMKKICGFGTKKRTKRRSNTKKRTKRRSNK